MGRILEKVVDPKYTLIDRLWKYLQNYAKKHRSRGNGFGYGLFGPEDMARTLSARYYKDGSEILIKQSGRNPRRLTPAECTRLKGFTKSFKIEVSDTQAYRQFGNAVVVPVVEVIAERMLECLARARQIRQSESRSRGSATSAGGSRNGEKPTLPLFRGETPLAGSTL